ncbi:hypothetical protein [Azotobacter chroococcum]|uniref:hypothetical protein n=1 Tax=Azotobacter chroococcum TaxID=353 RepID=UPI0010AE9710|nr:hypothetical protein [Azotobacter chroococcum]TKD34313.1 hypothetical protein FCG41_19960 [Azotobacter chroococcum]
MTNKIDFNVSGGNVALGATSQGNNNKTDGTVSITSTVIEREYEAAKVSIGNLADELQRSKVEHDAVLAHLASLKQKAADQPQKTEEGKSILKLVGENFSWAYPAIKDFIKVAWPALLAVVGA